MVSEQRAYALPQSRHQAGVPALEPSHAIAYLKKLAPKMDKSQIVVVCLSGRGDKDVDEVKRVMKRKK